MLRRTDQGTRSALITAVNAEVLAIHSNDTVPGKELAQANQAQIGQIGMTVGVTQRQSFELRQVVVAVKSECDQSLANQGEDQRDVLQVERRLSQHRFASE